MNTYIKIHTLMFDEDSGSFKVYLDESGDIPSIKIGVKGSIDDHILTKLNECFYQVDDTLLSACKLVSATKESENIDIVYNIYCYDNLVCKVGKFVRFDKRSMDLYRFAKNNRGQHE